MLVVIVTVGALLVVGAAVVARRASTGSRRQWSRWLQWAAFVVAVLAAVVVGPAAVRDSGWFAVVLLGVPIVLAALPPAWDLTVGRAGSVVMWLTAVLTLVWAVLLALGLGLVFLPAAFLMLAAATIRTAGVDAELANRA